jgi:hypothetical protein
MTPARMPALVFTVEDKMLSAKDLAKILTALSSANGEAQTQEE